MRRVTKWLAALVALASGAPAWAQDYGDPEGRTLAAIVDLRVTAADGERSWIDGGYGKTRWSGDGDSYRIRARAVEGAVAWQPQISWSLSGSIVAIAQAGQEHPVDLSEATLSYRHAPIGTLRLSVRAGLMWPSVSLEHSGPAWSVTETITPSAINSWIGEEVKVVGGEATASLPMGQSGRVYATLGLFGMNDTAGTLLAFRGWALHDEKAVAFGHQPLPPLFGMLQKVQAGETRPVIDLDSRVGAYGRLAWTVTHALRLNVFYYDNRGDPKAVTPSLQWGWRTRFGDIGATWQLDGRTKLTSQAMLGTTQMGYPLGGLIWVDTTFRSAFLLATRSVGAGSVSGRIEAFGTNGHGSLLGADSGENGWAATLATRQPIGRHVTVLGEVLHVESDRGDRVAVGLDPRQRQTVLQLAVRLGL